MDKNKAQEARELLKTVAGFLAWAAVGLATGMLISGNTEIARDMSVYALSASVFRKTL